MQNKRVNEEKQQRKRGKEERRRHHGHGPSPDLSLEEHFFEPENPVRDVVSRLGLMVLIIMGTRRGPPLKQGREGLACG